MILSTLYTQKYSIIQILWSAVLVVVLYVNYLQNKQIKLLNKKIEELSTNSTEIIQRLADKEKELDILINKISTTQVDTLLIAENNENIKLYLLIAGGVVLCASGFYIFNNIFQIFSLKRPLPNAAKTPLSIQLHEALILRFYRYIIHRTVRVLWQ